MLKILEFLCFFEEVNVKIWWFLMKKMLKSFEKNNILSF
jgi:hypothetical protein